MANTQKYLNHLLQNTGITPACSEEERAAANIVADIFKNHGFEPEIQEFTASSSAKLAQAAMGLMVFVGAVLIGVGGAVGIVGLLLAVAGAGLFGLERTGHPVLSAIGRGGLSQNVIAYHKASGPLASPRNRPVVVVAHYDSPRADLLAQQPYAAYRPVVVKLLPFAMLAPAIIAVVRMMPVPAAAKTVLWIIAILVALVPLVQSVAIIANKFVLPYTSGSVCNKSSVASMLGIMDAVAPYQGVNEFPADTPFDEFMDGQQAAAVEPAAEFEPTEENPYGVEGGVVMQPAYESEDEDEQQDVPAAPVPDQTGSMPAVPADQTSSIPASSLDDEPSLDQVPVQDEPAADAFGSTITMSSDEIAAALGQEPVAADEPVVEDFETEAPALPLNAEGNIRYGSNVLAALGMVAPSCAFVYEEGALPVPPAPRVEPALVAEPEVEAPAPVTTEAPFTAAVESAEPAEPVVPAEPEASVQDELPALEDVIENQPARDELSFEDDEWNPADALPALDEEVPVADFADQDTYEVAPDYILEAEYEVIDEAPQPAPAPAEAVEESDEEAEPMDPGSTVSIDAASIDKTIEVPAVDAAIDATVANADPVPAENSDEEDRVEQTETPVGTDASEEQSGESDAADVEEVSSADDAVASEAEGAMVDTAADTQLFSVPDQAAADQRTQAMPPVQPQQPVETVDSLMAQISNPQPRPQRQINVPTIGGAAAQQPRRIPSMPGIEALQNPAPANRTPLFDLPDPSVKPSDPFASPVSAPSAPASTRGFSVVSSPAPAPAAERIDTIKPAPVEEEKPRRGLGKLFGRKKKQQDSMSEWLGVDNDFDAKRNGGEIGSWDNFDDDNGWKGGATGVEGMTEEELRDAITSMGDDELLGHDIWFVATGASECGNAGIKAFLDTHRDKLRGVFLVNLESVGAGQLAMLSTEGDGRVLKGDKRIMKLVQRVSADFHHEFGAVDMPFLATDAYAAMSMSLRSLTIAGVDSSHFACSHTEEDQAYNVDESNVAKVADVVTEVIRRS